MQGIIKYWNKQKGYGFITCEDEKEIFLHYSNVIDEKGFSELKQGDMVFFDLAEGNRGLSALNVKWEQGAEREETMSAHKELKSQWNEFNKQGQIKLKKKMPVFIKLCLQLQHKPRGFDYITDELILAVMSRLMKQMCLYVQGCVFSYYSLNRPEIFLIVTDYHKFYSDAWLDYDMAKMCSNVASKASVFFLKELHKFKEEFYCSYEGDDKEELYGIYNQICEDGVVFKVRCFNVSEENVVDMIYYRQRENTRNMVGHYCKKYLTKCDILGKAMSEIKYRLKKEFGVDLDKLPSMYMNGFSCHKGPDTFTTKNKFTIDYEMPLLEGENRKYLQEIMDTVRHPDERNDWY